MRFSPAIVAARVWRSHPANVAVAGKPPTLKLLKHDQRVMSGFAPCQRFGGSCGALWLACTLQTMTYTQVALDVNH